MTVFRDDIGFDVDAASTPTGEVEAPTRNAEACEHDSPPTPIVDAALPQLMTLYLREVRRFSRLSPDDELRLFARLTDGDVGARDALICHHLGLVIAMARGFANRGLDLLDLIEEGNLGMLVALHKFEPERGLRFSTYAAWWIRYYLQTAIATQVPIVRPPLRAQKRAGIQAWQQWRDCHSPPSATAPDGAVLPAAPMLTPDAPLVTPVPMHDADIEAQIEAADLHHRDVLEEVAEQYDAPRLAALLHTLVAQLPARHRDIVIARFGLDGQDEYTLQQLGAERGLSRERIRQLQTEALQALREGLESAGITREVALA
jgi:RNA polymerase sigma factor (sigma-70 family)